MLSSTAAAPPNHLHTAIYTEMDLPISSRRWLGSFAAGEAFSSLKSQSTDPFFTKIPPSKLFDPVWFRSSATMHLQIVRLG